MQALPATQDEQDSNEKHVHYNLPSSTEAIQRIHTLMAFVKSQSNQEQLLDKCIDIEADLRHLVLMLKQQKKQTVSFVVFKYAQANKNDCYG